MDKYIAIARLAAALVTATAALWGVSIDADALTVGALVALALAAYAWSWWKNNNVTDAAIEAQKVLDHLKAEKRD